MHKRDFGSFHVSNVDELIDLPLSEYAQPVSPVQESTFDYYGDGKIEFGKTIRKHHFYLEEDCIFVNHGAFGSALKEGLEVAQRWQIHAEKQPLRFIDRELLPLVVHATRRIAGFVGADPRNVLLMQNVTTALNCILKSIDLQPGDLIFSLSTTYGATKKILKQVSQQSGAAVQEAEVIFPLKDKNQIIDLVRTELKEGTKLAIFDHIPSNTPVVLPVEDLIKICHERGVQVLIDGAHAMGSVRLNLKNLNPDFYVANCHKWLCAPKGVAFMYLDEKMHKQVHPVITSHGYGSGLHGEFAWQGLRDYSGWLALPTVLNFWNCIGPERIRDYMHSLASEAAQYLTALWKSQTMAPLSMFGSMVLVQLPSELWDQQSKVTYNEAEAIQNKLYHDYNIEVPVKVVGNSLCTRISAHIYNTLEDYKRLGQAVLEISTSVKQSGV